MNRSNGSFKLNFTAQLMVIRKSKNFCMIFNSVLVIIEFFSFILKTILMFCCIILEKKHKKHHLRK